MSIGVELWHNEKEADAVCCKGILTLGMADLYHAQIQLSTTPALACAHFAFNVLSPSTLASS